MPSYNERIYRRNKVKGLPNLGQVLAHSTRHDRGGYRDANTPFRLPKLHQPSAEPSRTGSVSSYYRREFLAPTPDPTVYTQTAEYLRMTGSPLKVPIRSSYDYPRLTGALIAPNTARVFLRPGASNRVSTSNAMTTSQLVRPQTALSNAGSIHWAMGTAASVNFDKTGRSRQQGPFSRVFTKTCMAPANWVKMKYGRANTVM